MNDDISLDRSRRAFRVCPNGKPGAGLLYAFNLGSGANVDSDRSELFHQPVNEVWVEMSEHALASLQDRDLRTCAGGDVRELCRDVTAADQNHPLRQALQVKKILAGRQVLLAGNTELYGLRSGRDQEMAALENLVIDLHRVPVGKPRMSVEGFDALRDVHSFVFCRDRVGKASLECDQVRPVDV